MQLMDKDALMKELEKEAELADDWKTAHEIVNVVKYFPVVGEDINVPGKWISVKDRLPESGKHVFLTCEIRLLSGRKKHYTCVGFYSKAHTLPCGSGVIDDDYCYDYDEEDDEYYLKEGWYEAIHNWDEYSSIVISDFVTHWMPLPEPQKGDEQ